MPLLPFPCLVFRSLQAPCQQWLHIQQVNILTFICFKNILMGETMCGRTRRKFRRRFPGLSVLCKTIYRVIQILCVQIYGCRLQPSLACWPVSGPSDCRCFRTLTLLFQFIFRVDGHAHQRTFAKQNHQRLLIVIIVRHSAVSVQLGNWLNDSKKQAA